MNAALDRLQELTGETLWPICHACGRSITAGGVVTDLDDRPITNPLEVDDYVFVMPAIVEHTGTPDYDAEVRTYHDEHAP